MAEVKIFKFGGASVKNAAAIKNVGEILKKYPKQKLLVNVSAINKTTNALEEIVDLGFRKDSYLKSLDQIVDFHNDIILSLFGPNHLLFAYMVEWRNQIIDQLKKPSPRDEMYDQVVSMGEIISSKIVYETIKSEGIVTEWIDAKNFIFASYSIELIIVIEQPTIMMIPSSSRQRIQYCIASAITFD